MQKFHAMTLDDIEAEIRTLDVRRRALRSMLAGRLLQAEADAVKAQRAIERTLEQ